MGPEADFLLIPDHRCPCLQSQLGFCWTNENFVCVSSDVWLLFASWVERPPGHPLLLKIIMSFKFPLAQNISSIFKGVCFLRLNFFI